MESVSELFSNQGFMPHAHCYLGIPRLVWTMAITDTVIGLSYIAITLTLYRLVRRIQLPFSPMILAFALFIGACGTGHFLDVYTLWVPNYWLSAFVKILTAQASFITAIILIKQSGNIIKVATAAKESLARAEEIQRKSAELEQANAALMISEERFRLLVDGVSDYAIYALDLDGNVMTWNAGAKKTKYYDGSEIIGKHFSVFYTEEDRQSGLPAYALTLALQGTFEEDGWRIKKDGTRFWANVIITAIRSADGTPIGFTKITRDHTERVNAAKRNAKLEVEKRAAMESSRLKTDFLATVTHELRTPINGIVGMAELLRRTTMSEQQEEFAESISISSRNLLVVINDILNFSALESDKSNLEIVSFKSETMFEDLRKTFTPRAASKDLSFDIDIDPTVPLTMQSDLSLLTQTMRNLLGNAIKFTDQGSVRVRVSAVTKDSNSCQLTVEVIDTGVGISYEESQALFKPFNKADATARRKHGGLGLGLSSSKRMIEIMGGQIGFEPNAPGGSKFWIKLPVGVDVGAPEVGQAPKVTSARILVVEDNLVNQAITVAMLKKLGHETMTAVDGIIALDVLKKNAFDLVFMDCQMPEMDGYECTRRIRQQVVYGNLPIVALTANSLPTDRQRCIDSGMSDYLAKPASVSALQQMIEKWVPVTDAISRAG